MEDKVLKPAHYMLQVNGEEVETKHVIRALLGVEGYKHWLEGNVLKYMFRWKKKNGLEDLLKAQENLRMLIEEVDADWSC